MVLPRALLVGPVYEWNFRRKKSNHHKDKLFYFIQQAYKIKPAQRRNIFFWLSSLRKPILICWHQTYILIKRLITALRAYRAQVMMLMAISIYLSFLTNTGKMCEAPRLLQNLNSVWLTSVKEPNVHTSPENKLHNSGEARAIQRRVNTAMTSDTANLASSIWQTLQSVCSVSQ